MCPAQGFKLALQLSLVLKFMLLITKLYQYKIQILAASNFPEFLEINILVYGLW